MLGGMACPGNTRLMVTVMNSVTTMRRCVLAGMAGSRTATPVPASPSGLDDFSVMLVRDRDNHPDCRHGSLLFLGDTDFVDNGFYVVRCGDVSTARLIQQIWGDSFILHATGRPWLEQDQQVTRRELGELSPRRVVGVLQPQTSEFAQLMRERFGVEPASGGSSAAEHHAIQ